MRQDLQQNQTQRLQQRLTSQQVRYVRLLEMNEQEAEAAVERELDDNPALEKAEDQQPVELRYYPAFQGRGSEPEWTPVAADDTETLYDYLERQIGERDLDESVAQIARYIVGNLDSNGYLQRSLQAMSDDLAFGPGIETTPEQMEQALSVVRSLDPAGVGACGLQDSLELQLLRLRPSQAREDALRIVREAFDAFTMKHTHRIVSMLKIGAPRVDAAVSLILTLNPKPGSAIGGGHAEAAAVVVPDFIVDVADDGDIKVSLPGRIPALAIEESFEQAVKRLQKEGTANDKKGAEFIMSRYGDARDFIAIMRQRRDTLFAVMTSIVHLQREYFLTGDERDLRPMALKDVASEVGMDVSTVSRATAAKYVSTPMGILPLRFFFSEGYGEGDEQKVSARGIQAVLRQLVEDEDKKHPLSDEALCSILADKGYVVSRRTVAKYRDKLGLPVARLRKQM